MRILLVNDDGIEAKGIRVLADALKEQHEVYIVAPASQRSCFSHSVTYYYKPNKAEMHEIEGVKKAWSVDATPADCTYYALNGLLDEKMDLVISGINHGPNLSSDTIYSGTVGAASEGMINGVPSIAISVCRNKPVHFEAAATVIIKLIEPFMKDPRNLSYILNVNVPDLPREEIKGVRLTRFAGTLNYRKPVKKEMMEDGTYILSCKDIPVNVRVPGVSERTDTRAVAEGYVSVSLLDNNICTPEWPENPSIYESMRDF